MFSWAFPRHSLKTRILVATLALFAAGIWSLSLFTTRTLLLDMEHQLGDQQFSIATYVATEVDKELRNRIRGLELVAKVIDAPLIENHNALQRFLEQHHVLLDLFNGGLFVSDANGTAIADVPLSTGRTGINYLFRDYLRAALKDGVFSVSEPITGTQIKSTVTVIAVPIRDTQNVVIGALCGVTRLDQPNFLDQITNNQYGQTGGYLMYAPRNRLIIAATDKTRVMEHLAPPGSEPKVDRFVAGYEGTDVVVNGKGVEVVASVRRVPTTGWHVVASLPTKEAFAPIAEMRKRMLLATVLLSFVAGGLVWWLLQRQLRPLETTARKLAGMGRSKEELYPLPVTRSDEIGLLIAAFNDLLAVLKRREAALQESEERFKALHEGSFGGIAIHDKGIILDGNQSLADMTGYSRDELIGMDGLLFVAPAWRELVRQNIRTGNPSTYEAQGLRKDGTTFPMAIRGKNIPYKGQTVRVTEFRDITVDKQVEQQQQIAAIAFESQEGLIITDAEHRIVRANHAFATIVGYPIDEIQGKHPRMLHSERFSQEQFQTMIATLESSGFWQGEILFRRKNGEDFPAWITITAVRSATNMITHYVTSVEDITQRKIAEEEIKHLAFFDQLTGLPNRRLLADRLKQALSASCRHNHCGALLFIDLDNFKTLNDTLGHDQGDLLLQRVAERLAKCVREGDTVARLGGDEFVVMLETLSDSMQEAASHAEMIGEKIIASLGQPYHFSGYEHHSSASIGIAMFLGCNDNAEELLKRADMAMYQAKSAGRNTLRFFDPEMQSMVSARATLEAGLREAVQKNDFLLNYQAQVNSAHRLTGAEALLRWHNPQYIQVPPRAFIPLAEETGLILAIGRWVLENACQRLASWAKDPALSELSIAVNISVRQFQQKNFVEDMLGVIERSGAPPQRLKLELTESMLADDVDDVIAKMTALKAKGITFSLDDFGTGYSSLTYLKRLPLDQLKIDQGFVRDILSNPDDAAIARMIVTLGENFGLTVIAEGVESEEQLLKLAEQGCNNYQGYLFSRPLPPSAFEDYAKSMKAAEDAADPPA